MSRSRTSISSLLLSAGKISLLLACAFVLPNCSLSSSSFSSSFAEQRSIELCLFSATPLTRTLSYEVKPPGSAQGVRLELYFLKGEEDISSCLKAELNETKGQITISCLSPFSSTAFLEIKSLYVEDLSRQVRIDYSRKMIDLEQTQEPTLQTHIEKGMEMNEGELLVFASSSFAPIYSSFSLPLEEGDEPAYRLSYSSFSAYKGGNVSPFGDIDMSNTLLRDSLDGETLMSYFDNEYRRASDYEKSIINTFPFWGVERKYTLSISYKEALYRKEIIHLLYLRADELPSYQKDIAIDQSETEEEMELRSWRAREEE